MSYRNLTTMHLPGVLYTVHISDEMTLMTLFDGITLGVLR